MKANLRFLSVSRISGIYMLVLLVVGFSIWLPDLFPTSATARNIGESQAVTAIVVLGLLFPVAAGGFDLSVGYILGASNMIVAGLLSDGMDPALAIAITLLCALAIGVINAILVVGVGIDSFIATLGVSSVLQALIFAISGNQAIIGLPSSFQDLTAGDVVGIPNLVIYMSIVAFFCWYGLEHTRFGRQLFAVGLSSEAARLAGVRTKRVLASSFVVSALCAGIGGVLVTAKLGSGSPEIGSTYLLPAFAAVFLGATQIKPGRPNVVGALVATFLLGTGTIGLQLAGAQFWVTYLFNGVALIVAVGLAVTEDRFRLLRAARQRAAARAAEAKRGEGFGDQSLA